MLWEGSEMAKRKVDLRTKMFMDFFSEELGVEFVDADTKEKIEPITEVLDEY